MNPARDASTRGSNDRSHGERSLGDGGERRHRLPAEIREQAGREARRRVLAVHVFVTKSGQYTGVTGDDAPNLKRYRRTATEVAVIQPKLPSLRTLLAELPKSIRTEAQREADKRGVPVIVFLLRNGSYVGVTGDDAPALMRFRSQRTTRELFTVPPAATKAQPLTRRASEPIAPAREAGEVTPPHARKPARAQSRRANEVKPPRAHAAHPRATPHRAVPEPPAPPIVEMLPDASVTPAIEMPAPVTPRAPRKRMQREDPQHEHAHRARVRRAAPTPRTSESPAPEYPASPEYPAIDAEEVASLPAVEPEVMPVPHESAEDKNLDQAEAMMASLQKLLEQALQNP